MMDLKCSLVPINPASKLLHQHTHGDDRLDIFALGDHHTTWSNLKGSALTVGKGHRDLLVVVLGFTQTHWTQWVCGT